MQTKIYLLAITLFFISCAGNKQQEVKQQTSSNVNALSEKEKTFCVETLQGYFNSDSLQSKLWESAKAAKAAALAMNKNDTTDFLLYFRQLTVEVDSLSKSGIKLLNTNDYNSLLNMLEKNQGDFRAHPFNDTEQDWNFCQMIFILNQHISSEEKAIDEYLKDTEITSAKLQFFYTLNNTLHPLYIPFYEDRAMAYYRKNDIPKAMEVLNKLLSDVKNTLGEKSEDYEDILSAIEKLKNGKQ